MSRRKVEFVEVRLTAKQSKDLMANWEHYEPDFAGECFITIQALGYNISMSRYKGQPQATAFARDAEDDGKFLAVAATAPTDASALVALMFKLVKTASGDLTKYRLTEEAETIRFE